MLPFGNWMFFGGTTTGTKFSFPSNMEVFVLM
jgi:hypothetical protein